MGKDETLRGAAQAFASFEPRLRQALTAWGGPHDVDDAVAETFAYLCANEARIMSMDNPQGYLFTVARSKLRGPRRKRVHLPPVPEVLLPEVEPALPDALADLTPHQRTSVFLIAGLGWTASEVGEILGIGETSVRNHHARALAKLRKRIGGIAP